MLSECGRGVLNGRCANHRRLCCQGIGNIDQASIRWRWTNGYGWLRSLPELGTALVLLPMVESRRAIFDVMCMHMDQ
jgi:hypothetical protein